MRDTRVALYVRVSTKEQSPAAQLSELKKLAEQRKWKYEVFCDRGQSGAKESRPAFDEMMRQVRRGHFSSVCIWALDRMARSVRQLLDISLELKRVNVDLISVKQDLDTSSPAGRLVYGVLVNRCRIRTRTLAGAGSCRCCSGTTSGQTRWQTTSEGIGSKRCHSSGGSIP
jgi:DNA invertase Pin-like site-specific DNA recombinase